jgi:hypothetical protein
MRSLSPSAITKLATTHGNEPIAIIEVQWAIGGTRVPYADRNIASIPGRILEISALDNTIQIANGGTGVGGDSQQISVVLDDTDGSIKSILDTLDVHKRDVWVYQTFEGLAPDKFLLFRGQINSPMEWDEGARTVSFDIISKIEDVEVGFSIEEGNIPNPPAEAIGKPWPLCFGTVQNVPALRLKSVRQGTLATGVGIKDFMLEQKRQLADGLSCGTGQQIGWKAGSNIDSIGFAVGTIQIDGLFAADADCQKRMCEEKERLNLMIEEQTAAEESVITIFGGSDFPQNTPVKIDINGGKFYGSFNGDTFTITGREHPDIGPDGTPAESETTRIIKSICRGTDVEQPQGDQESYASYLSRLSWDKYDAVSLAGFFWADAGSVVTLDTDSEILYIANILPSTILRVAAYRTVESGRRILLTVPDSYYSIRTTDYTGYEVVEIVLTRPLSERREGWDDELFISLTSSVGPNTVDILEWFISKYTDYSTDATFADVRTQLEAYPMHFWLKDRKSIIQVLQEIAFQARCALVLRDDVFSLYYLPLLPTPVDTIDVSDIEANTLVLGHTGTEDIVTKYVVTWQKDYSQEPNKLILRHNVSKYGTQEQSYEFYCFAHLELVQKSATFWLIRKANTWRRVRFKTPLTKLALETFDAISLDVEHISDDPITCIVEAAEYDSGSNTLSFEVWTPVKAGSRVPYDFAYPA